MPGYAKCFDDVFDCRIAMAIAREFGSAVAVSEAGLPGLKQRLQNAGVRTHASVLPKILGWARTAPAAEMPAALHHRFLIEADDDRLSKLRSIRKVEGELAGLLVRTPYVLLLGIPGINVVSAGEFAGEMGPIGHYPNSRAITGRAGLFPSRHQSDHRLDHKRLRRVDPLRQPQSSGSRSCGSRTI